MPERDPKTGRFTSSKGGAGVGTAQGAVTIDTSGVVEAERVVKTSSEQMTDSMGGVDKAVGKTETGFRRFGQSAGGFLNSVASNFRSAQKYAQDFAKSDLGVVQKGLDSAGRALAPISLAAGAIAAGGIAAARQLQILNAQMVVFTGSQAKATALQKQLHQIADDTGQSYLDIAQGALQVLPILGRTNADLGETLSVVQRLAALNPEQGAAGAGLAIREVLTGQNRSLVNRFNLSPSDIEAVTKAANGDPQKIIAGLSGVIDKLGLTQDAFNKLNKSGINAFSQLKGEVTETLGTAFTPLLQGFVLPAVKGFSSLVRGLRETNPALLSIGAAGATVIAGLAPALLLVSQLITAFKNLKTVGIALPNLGKGLAVGGGLLLGDLAARGLANAGVTTGDLGRVAKGEDPLAIVGERLKQGVVVLTDGILGGVKPIVQAFAFAGSIVQNGGTVLKAAFEAFKAVIQSSIGNLNQSFGELFVQLANNFSGLFDTTNLRKFGEDMQTVGKVVSDAANQKLIDAGNSLVDPLTQAAAAAKKAGDDFDQTHKQIVTGLSQGLGLIPAAQTVENAADDTASSLNKVTEAANPLAESLKNNQDKIEEAAKKLIDLKNDFDREQKQTNDQRSIDAGRENFDAALQRARENRDFQQNILEQDRDFYRQRERSIADFNSKLQDEDLALMQQQAKERADFAEQELRNLEDHGDRLDQIQKETQRSVREAASSLDAIAVLRAQQNGQQQLDEENKQFEKAQQRRLEDFQQQQNAEVANRAASRNAEIAAFQQQLADQQQAHDLQRQHDIAAFAQRIADENQDRAIRLQRQREDYAREDQLRRDAYNRQRSDIITQLAQETGIRRQWIASIVTSLASAGGHFKNFADFINQQIARLGTSEPAVATPTSTQITPTAFAGGGKPPLYTPIRHSEQGRESAVFSDGMFALLTKPAQIIPANQTRDLLSGGANANRIFNTGPFSFVFNDVGSHSSSEMEQMVYRSIAGVLRELKAMGV